MSDHHANRRRGPSPPPSRAARAVAAAGRASERPDRFAFWAVVMTAFTVLVAAASAHGAGTGGVQAPAPAGESAPVATAPAAGSAQLGARPLAVGMSGPDVTTLQGVLRAKRYGPPELTGEFDGPTARGVRRFESDRRLPADGVADRRTVRALVRSMRPANATFYGPGLWGNRTACGVTLTPSTVGVAHKSLPCGTLVTVSYRGRFVRAKVIDRGPYRAGYAWDLTQATAEAVGMASSAKIRTVHERPSAQVAHRSGSIAR